MTIVAESITVDRLKADSVISDHIPDLLIVDWSNLIHRTFHGLGGGPEILSRDLCLIAEQGLRSVAQGVLFEGFRVVIVLDGGHSGRRDIFAGYKASRSERADRPPALVTALDGPTRDQYERLPIVQVYGYEADDTMAALAHCHPGNSYILTNDRDLLQAVNETTWILVPRGQFDAPELFGVDEVQEKYGFPPTKIPEYKALQGDPTDDVPSIPGVGHGRACKLVQDFGGIDGAYQAARRNMLTPKLNATMLLYRESILRNLQLVTLIDVPGIADVYRSMMEKFS